MADLNKKGLDYFPFQVGFFDDDKIQLIEGEFGVKGSLIAVRLLCKIYKEEGYYYQWGDDQCLLFAKGTGLVQNLVNDVVLKLVKRSFFDEGVFNRFQVLTSKGIQKRYMKVVKDSKLKRDPILEKYDLLKNSEEKSKNSEDLRKNSEENRQSKVKKSKVNIITNVMSENHISPPEKIPDLISEEKEKEKSSAKKENPPDGLYWKTMVKTWFDFYRLRYADTPTFNDTDGKHLKMLIKFLKRDTVIKGNEWTEDHAVLCLSKFMNLAQGIEWYRAHFQLKNLVSNYDSIKQSQQKSKNEHRVRDYSVKL